MSDTMQSTTTQTWKRFIGHIAKFGRPVAPLSAGAEWRGNKTREIIGLQTVVDMNQPVICSPARKLGLKFLVAEAAWIASGDNRVSTIEPYSKKIRDFSDDGMRFFGSYGPKFIEQLSFVVDALYNDPDSRQAVINVWREQPRKTKDTPCTLSWQFLLRNGRLNCVATMRSSDMWTGWVYDVFNFSVVSTIVLIELRNRFRDKGPATMDAIMASSLELGNLYLTAGSQHVYVRDIDDMQAVLTEPEQPEPAPINPAEFATGQDLINHLWSLAKNDGTAHHKWLRELF